MLDSSTCIVNPPSIVQPADADLAAAINTEHRAVASALNKGVAHARAAGELLLKAKAQCKHGEWLPWLTKHCPDIGIRQCQKYLRLAKRLPANATSDSHSSIDEALEALSDSGNEVIRRQAEKWEKDFPDVAAMHRELADLMDELDAIREAGPSDDFATWKGQVVHLRGLVGRANEIHARAKRMDVDVKAKLGELLKEKREAESGGKA